MESERRKSLKQEVLFLIKSQKKKLDFCNNLFFLDMKVILATDNGVVKGLFFFQLMTNE